MTVSAFYLRFILLTALLSGIGCIYFSQRKYIFTVDEESLIVGQVVAINNVTEVDGCLQGTFRLKDEDMENSELFNIDKSGWISVADEIDTDSSYVLIVSFTCIDDSETSTAMVEVYPNESCQYTDAVDSSQLSRMAFNMCFQQDKMDLYVEENKLPDTLGNLAKCQQKSLANKLIRKYDNFDQSILQIDNRTTTLKLRRKLDRENETSSILKYNIICVANLTDASASFTSTCQVSINIADVNDSPPLLQNEYIEATAKGNQVVEALIIDKDVTSDKDFKVDVVNDTHDLCKIHMFKCLPIKRDQDYTYEYTVCRLMINTVSPIDTVNPNNFCKIAIVDNTFISTTNKSGKAVLTIIFLSQDKARPVRSNISYTTFISGAATKYAKVYTQVPPSAYFLRQSSTAFRLKYPGILYIFDVNAFQQLESPYNLTMQSETHIINLKIIKVDIVQDTQKACNLTCSRYMGKSSCTSACGIGSPTGKCQWRSGKNISMTMTYSTCVPDINTCPDGICDSVEQLNPSICPQDCTLLNVVGEGELDTSHNPAMGIKRGTSPCWCDYTTQCTCFRPSIPEKSNQLEIKVYNSNNTKQKAQSASPSLVLEKENSSSGNILPQSRPRAGAPDLYMHCDWNCRTTIAATGGCIGAIMCVIFLAWRLRKTKCQKSKTLKHVDSIGSISGMPSDYLDDRDYRTTHSSPHWSPKRSTEYSQTYEDYKWEFPREKLVLEKTLGEGEFGRVVKAKAYGLNGKEGYKDVAVKMLKNCAASGELQDLLSEFNLLKDVNHSNVIRLLGACTKGGPCYVIVEYCEHGSLLHYLRGARLEENGYVNHRLRRLFRHQTDTGEAIETEILNIRHLLSFAWQIAKGMRYLSEIKLVHRDLAARNILVGSGKVLKISDFGLTRDVYEADTYFKKSKGRIPVKWLAPESLYAQIYTTQSDVWSFGIVLWEIVTLGAPPYPGIPPERLYNLLIAGYRMDRPEGCSDELYAVMQKCWKSEPAARPTFADLGTIFDQMLQQRTEYLEITGGFEDANPDLFDRHFDNTNVTDQVNNSPANGNPYLTPTSAVDRDDDSDRKPRDVKVHDDVGQSANMKHKTTGSTINESENVALLLNSRTVVFSNSFDSEDDLNVRQTGLGQIYT